MRKFTFTLLTVFLFTGAFVYAARAQSFSDVQIKAAYIFKLSQFITWDGSRKSPINFCYIESTRQSEDASVGQSFERLVTAKNAGAQWRVSRIRGLTGIAECDALFIAESEDSSLSNILTQIAGKNILTISDMRRFINRGGMLGFVVDSQDRIQMEANLITMKKTNVMIGAVVLELMSQVIK